MASMIQQLPYRIALIALVTAFLAFFGPSGAQQAAAQHGEESENMVLLGHNDLQARSAYQPVIHRQGQRWIAYIGHHGGTAFNPLTGVEETNGTSIVDVTDPSNPRYLRHIPGPSGVGEAGGAQMVRVCNGSELPKANEEAVYLLRSFGDEAHQVFDVRNPSSPVLVSTPSSGLAGTHKSWWECDTGIAYLVSGVPGWRTNRMTQIFDLSNPQGPVHIRDYGLVGQEPGATGPVPTGLHGPISAGHRVYFGHGTSSNGIVQIADRTKLLTGPRQERETAENLRFPIIAQYDTTPFVGAHTTFPVLGVEVRKLGPFNVGFERDIVVIVNESTANECIGESHQMVFLLDVTIETKPQVISNFYVPEKPGNFCERGGRFGAHSSNESFTPIYYGRVVFIAYFNAGVRAVDIRDPFRPKEAGFYIPATTANTDQRCITIDGVQRCKTAIQTNNVEVDDRGLVYIVDRANTGLHILQVTGPLREIANF
jgi:hypothetical protein